jgi:hypothetical protein
VPRHCAHRLNPLQSADRAHESRQHDVLVQLSQSMATVAAALAEGPAPAAPSPHHPRPFDSDDAQRICELEQEVETLKSSLASHALLGSLRASVGCEATGAQQFSGASVLPELQVHGCAPVLSGGLNYCLHSLTVICAHFPRPLPQHMLVFKSAFDAAVAEVQAQADKAVR